jgi:hypothetical protein
MGDSPEAWPQDDVGARAALLAWLEGQLPLEDAVARYLSCFPPAAGMKAEHVRRTWNGWNAARREVLAKQIRRGMSEAAE